MHAVGKTYEVIETLARGGMGEVSIARERVGELFERLVVLKTVLPHRADDEDHARALLDEARVVAQLQHPNIALVHDIAFRDGRLCIVMEWLRGHNFAEILRALRDQARTMPPETAVALLLGAAVGLGYAHGATDSRGRPLGIVHRDVSPHNLFLTREGTVKVIDFGIALSSQRTTETFQGVVKGKLRYMAPEQVMGLGADPRSDVWALGVVAWELLTCRRLFPKSDAVGALLRGPIVPPSSAGAESDQELDAILMSMLERELDRRAQSCAAVEEALMHWARHRRLPTARQLAAWLDDLLPAVRAHEPDLAAEATAIVTLMTPEEPLAEVSLTATVSGPARTGPEPGAQTAPVDELAEPLPAGRSTRARPLVVGILLGASAIVASALAWLSGSPGGSEASVSAPTRAATDIAAGPPAVRTVSFVVEGLPDGGTLLLDGVAVAGSSIEVRQGSGTYLLEVRGAAGETLLSRSVAANVGLRIPIVARPSRSKRAEPAVRERRPPPRVHRSRMTDLGSGLVDGIDSRYE